MRPQSFGRLFKSEHGPPPQRLSGCSSQQPRCVLPTGKTTHPLGRTIDASAGPRLFVAVARRRPRLERLAGKAGLAAFGVAQPPAAGDSPSSNHHGRSRLMASSFLASTLALTRCLRAGKTLVGACTWTTAVWPTARPQNCQLCFDSVPWHTIDGSAKAASREANDSTGTSIALLGAGAGQKLLVAC
jgi:hypothetical protein